MEAVPYCSIKAMKSNAVHYDDSQSPMPLRLGALQRAYGPPRRNMLSEKKALACSPRRELGVSPVLA